MYKLFCLSHTALKVINTVHARMTESDLVAEKSVFSIVLRCRRFFFNERNPALLLPFYKVDPSIQKQRTLQLTDA